MRMIEITKPGVEERAFVNLDFVTTYRVKAEEVYIEMLGGNSVTAVRGCPDYDKLPTRNRAERHKPASGMEKIE